MKSSLKDLLNKGTSHSNSRKHSAAFQNENDNLGERYGIEYSSNLKIKKGSVKLSESEFSSDGEIEDLEEE